MSSPGDLKRMISMAQTSGKRLKRSTFIGLNRPFAEPGTQSLGLRLHHCWCWAGHFYLASLTKTPDIRRRSCDLLDACLCVSTPKNFRSSDRYGRPVCGRKGSITCPYLSQWERVGRENGSSSGVCNGKVHSGSRAIY